MLDVKCLVKNNKAARHHRQFPHYAAPISKMMTLAKGVQLMMSGFETTVMGVTAGFTMVIKTRETYARLIFKATCFMLNAARATAKHLPCLIYSEMVLLVRNYKAAQHHRHLYRDPPLL